MTSYANWVDEIANAMISIKKINKTKKRVKVILFLNKFYIIFYFLTLFLQLLIVISN